MILSDTQQIELERKAHYCTMYLNKHLPNIETLELKQSFVQKTIFSTLIYFVIENDLSVDITIKRFDKNNPYCVAVGDTDSENYISCEYCESENLD